MPTAKHGIVSGNVNDEEYLNGFYADHGWSSKYKSQSGSLFVGPYTYLFTSCDITFITNYKNLFFGYLDFSKINHEHSSVSF